MKRIVKILTGGLALLSLTAVLPTSASAAAADGFSLARVPSLQGVRARQNAQAGRHGSALAGVSWLAIAGAAAVATGVIVAAAVSKSDKPVSPGS